MRDGGALRDAVLEHEQPVVLVVGDVERFRLPTPVVTP